VSLPPFLELNSLLSAGLSRPLPGVNSHLKMAPRSRADPGQLSVAGRACKHAAVMLLLIPRDDSAHILLTVRKMTLTNHAGQISLPGGRQEPYEELLQTALRETDEEVGVKPSSIDVLGKLSSLFIPPSGYCVHPFVGSSLTALPAPDNVEVDRILLAPATDLINPERRLTGTRIIGGVAREIPYFDLCGEIVWGATAMILAEFATILERELPGAADPD
jgi:8-oxo-dGTP pyrophosphatase MutT (NUDIX family)